MDKGNWWDRLQALSGVESGRVFGWDAVNEAMVRHWCEATGNTNPIYTDAERAKSSSHRGIVAPPTMLQVWLMPGLRGKRAAGSVAQDANDLMLALFAEGGFPLSIAVNSEQEYARYLRPSDRLYYTSKLESVSERKTTGLGPGHFATLFLTFFDQDEAKVATMRYTQLVYRQGEAS